MTSNRGQASAGRDRPHTVLIVEDEQPLRKLLSLTLVGEGYRVIEAEDGQAALEICERPDCAIDVVVTDVVMPRMSGPELVARLASLHPHARVIYMSAYADETMVSRAAADIGVGYLEKPFGPDALLTRIRDVLESRPKAA